MIKRSIIILFALCSHALCGTIGYYTSPTGDVTWVSVSFGNELVTVANEIAAVVNWAPGVRQTNEIGGIAVSAANSMTNKWTLREMQDMIISEYDELWFGTNAVLEGKTNYYALSAIGGQGTYENEFPIDEFYTACGISTNGFRRWTNLRTWPADWTDLTDTNWSFGTIHVGDALGPWNWDDIQRCFDKMTNRVVEGSWYSDQAEATFKYEAEGANTNWADLVSDVTANWASPDTISSNAAQPQHNALETYSEADGWWGLGATAARSKARVRSYGIGVTRIVKVLQRAAADTGYINVFDDNGDDVTNETWNTWATFTATPTGSVYYATTTNYLGGVDLPVIAATPSTNDIFRGWRTASKIDKGGEASINRPVFIEHFQWSYTRE